MFKRKFQEFKLEVNALPHNFTFKSSNRNYLHLPSHLSSTKMVCQVYLVLSACKMLSWGPKNAETYFVQSVSNCLQMQGYRELMSSFLIRMSHKNGLSTLNPPHTGEFPDFLFNKNKIKSKLA